ncbi:MAG: ATP-binding cassette domain-containing protein [Bacteroidales bacterium]
MLKVEDLSVRLGDFHLKDIGFGVNQGDYFILLGPSGSGKSVLLESIAGITPTDSGRIFLNGKDITCLPTGKRSIGLVFQDNTVFPHLTVRNNIRYALKPQKKSKTDADRRIDELSRQLFLDNLLHRTPGGLSGGELQRVLLARTLASDPQVLLLDEPLSSVDTMQKDALKELLRKLNRKGQTIIHVTHDYEEAVSLASHVGVMHRGHLLDTGTTAEVFSKPGNEFIARFCGFKNYFRACAIGKNKILAGNRTALEIMPHHTLPEEFHVLINSSQIVIHKEAKAGTPNFFAAEILYASPYHSRMEITVDIGIKLSVITDSFLSESTPEFAGIEIPPKAIRVIT